MIKTILIITALVAAALVLILAAALTIGASRWEKATEELSRRLESTRQPGSTSQPKPRNYQSGELEGLPEPVQRYFRTVLEPDAPIVTAAEVVHTGTFNMAETGSNWKPFTSRQEVRTSRPGFLWNGAITMMPGIKARVHDAYIGGEGILHASLGGLVSLMDLRGRGELARGELMRYFAEAAWYPTALLPRQGVQWEAADDSSAYATLTDGDIELTLLFRFNKEGLIASVYSEGRERMAGTIMESTPWEGRWSNYQRRNGMLVPISGEVLWYLPDGEQPYWRGDIAEIRYRFGEEENHEE
jgi:hypothetical protein